MKQMYLLQHAGRAAMIAAAVAVTLFPAVAHAQTTLISNLTQAQAGNTVFTTATDRFAQEFTATNTISSFLSARLILSQQITSATSDSAHLYIYTNSGSTPSSTILSDLGVASVSGTGAAQYAFSSSGSVTLTASQKYWLVLTDDISNLGWGYTTSTTTTGSGATVDATTTTASSPDNGASWLVQDNTQGLQFFALVTNSATPEPGSLTLFALGTLGTLGTGGTLVVKRRRGFSRRGDARRATKL